MIEVSLSYTADSVLWQVTAFENDEVRISGALISIYYRNAGFKPLLRCSTIPSNFKEARFIALYMMYQG